MKFPPTQFEAFLTLHRRVAAVAFATLAGCVQKGKKACALPRLTAMFPEDSIIKPILACAMIALATGSAFSQTSTTTTTSGPANGQYDAGNNLGEKGDHRGTQCANGAVGNDRAVGLVKACAGAAGVASSNPAQAPTVAPAPAPAAAPSPATGTAAAPTPAPAQFGCASCWD